MTATSEQEAAVEALRRGDGTAVARVSLGEVRVFVPVAGIASPGRVDGRGETHLKDAVAALLSWSGGPLEVVAQAHDAAASVVELCAAVDRSRPATAVLRWEAGRVGEVRLYFDPEEGAT